ncbi:hypothetical protein DVS28_a3912 [Euzebya pacifica]|uniref:DUF11 domain-containing protein n=1 Tax=Euzebya pacifica TaxID=1608957 RepID=A0A346Y287_9ACTN|nr:cell wall-binding repeat-containing protein [Euzebya pacifica]AXV08584.1 hypothetical protein DVS28_a3912 [Euzebya pacifica]
MRLQRTLLALGLLGAVLAPAAALAQPVVDGTTYVVDTQADGPIDSPTGCAATSGDTCTLREAIVEANTNAPGTTDLIVFDPTVFPPSGSTTIELTVGGSGPGEPGPNAASGDLDIVGSLVIHGPGVVIDASTFEGSDPAFAGDGPLGDRAFDVAALNDVGDNRRASVAGDPVDVTIEGLTVTGGTAASGDGGAIRAMGSCDDPSAVTLTLRDVLLEDNVVVSDGAKGGGLAAFGANVTVEDSIIRNNVAVRGGGIASAACGELVVNGSTITMNVTDLREARQFVTSAGAGIWSSTGLTIDRSVVSFNGAIHGGRPEQGGGIHVSEPDTTGPIPLSITDSVIEGNQSWDQGGGLWVNNRSYNDAPSGSIIEGTAFVDNHSFEGGGIYSQNSSGTINNSTIATNRAYFGAGVMVVEGGGTTTAGFSVVDLLHSTVEGNWQPESVPEFAGVTAQPASLQVRDSGGLAVMGFFNSVLQSTTTVDPTCMGSTTSSFVSLGGNSDDDGTCELTEDSDAPSTPQDLAGLAANDGPLAGDAPGVAVPTLALQPGSEGIDAAAEGPSGPTFAQTLFISCGQAGGAGETDQRGVPRPQDGDNNGTAVCDRGAFELRQQPPPTTTPTTVDVALDKDGPGDVLIGDDVTFTVTVTNSRNTAANVVVTDTIPAGLALVSASAPCTISGDTVTCDLGTLSAAASETVTIITTAEVEGSITNTACAATTSTDSNSSNDCDDHTVQVMQETQRVEGPERITTAVAGSQVAFDDGEADAVVLTRSDDFPDAQAGTALAIARNAALLLTQPDALALASEDELLRVMSPGGTVYLLGGTAALGQAVEDRVVELGYVVVRLAGANRFGTATAIAAELGDPGTLLLADGGDFPHSVVAGAAAVVAGDSDFDQAGNVGAAVLLTDGATVPPETQAYLDGRSDTPEIVPIGSPAADAFPEEEDAIVGGDAYEVSANVAATFFDGPSAIGVATGANFADALTGGSVVGRPDVGPGPVLLTAADALPASVGDYITSINDSVGRVLIFGGTAAIESSIEEEIQAILGG